MAANPWEQDPKLITEVLQSIQDNLHDGEEHEKTKHICVFSASTAV